MFKCFMMLKARQGQSLQFETLNT